MNENFIRFAEDVMVYRLYFTYSSMTLSKRKCGHLIHNIIKKCQQDNKKYRNDFILHGDYVEIFYINPRDNKTLSMFLDYNIWEKYHEYYFRIEMGYAYVRHEQENWRLHRLIMDLPLKVDRTRKKNIVDHLNGNPLDNRIENLRLTSFESNSKNLGFFNSTIESGVRGVTRTSKKDKWRVRFGSKEKSTYFNSLSDAVEFRYIRGGELGYYFREGSTTIENYIEKLKKYSE